MTDFFWWPVIFAGVLTFIWVAAAAGYNRASMPRTISVQAFGGPVRDYVFPGGFIAALACLLTTLLADRVAAYPPVAHPLQAAALMLTLAAMIGLVMYQSLENMKSADGLKVELKSSTMLMMLGAIYALLFSALLSIFAAILMSLSMPPKKTAPEEKALPKTEATDTAKEASNG